MKRRNWIYEVKIVWVIWISVVTCPSFACKKSVMDFGKFEFKTINYKLQRRTYRKFVELHDV